ncbi:MAG: hypothetical protein AAB495_01995 [Patescibacteria group bacterium]
METYGINPNVESQPPDILERINTALAGLGSTAKWKRAPKFEQEYNPLRGKTVIMVDDAQGVLEAFAPTLMVATEGKAVLILFNGQSAEELAAEIQAKKADIVLLDYHLSESIKGAAVGRKLLGGGFEGKLFGFSSDPDTVRAFRDAGVNDCISKEAGSPEKSVKDLAQRLGTEIT